MDDIINLVSFQDYSDYIYYNYKYSVLAENLKKIYDCLFDRSKHIRSLIEVNVVLIKKYGMEINSKEFYDALVNDYKSGVRIITEFKYPRMHTIKLRNNQAFICERCFAVIPATIDIHIGFGATDVKRGNLYMGICAECSYCNKMTYMYGVDLGIATTVSLFNKLGYTTEYSCQGHSKVHYRREENMKEWETNPYFVYSYEPPYIAINGRKKLTKKLVKELKRLGWDDFHIRPNGDPNSLIHTDDPSGEKEFCITFNCDYVDAKLDKIIGKKRSKKYEKFINESVEKYFTCRIDELNIVLNRMLKKIRRK